MARTDNPRRFVSTHAALRAFLFVAASRGGKQPKAALEGFAQKPVANFNELIRALQRVYDSLSPYPESGFSPNQILQTPGKEELVWQTGKARVKWSDTLVTVEGDEGAAVTFRKALIELSDLGMTYEQEQPGLFE